MINIRRKNFIIQQTRLLLQEVLKNSSDLFGRPVEPRDLFPLRMDVVIRDVLGLTYERPIEFSNLTLQAPKFQTVGLTRKQGENTSIVVPDNVKPEWQRFTAAHEVGHHLLHPGVLHFRHRPLTGGERANLDLPRDEQEANLFAAYLLMPKKQVVEYFEHTIGAPLDGRQINPELASWLGTVTDQSIDGLDLVKRGPAYRALLVAQLTQFNETRFLSLAERFGVSPSAMGYQLLDFELVK